VRGAVGGLFRSHRPTRPEYTLREPGDTERGRLREVLLVGFRVNSAWLVLAGAAPGWALGR
jgi:hypothetical protein